MKKRIYVLGSLSMELEMELDHFPRRGEELYGVGIHHNPGGKGGNQAIAASFYSGDVKLLSSVGIGAFSKDIIENLKSFNVNTENIKRVDVHTGTTIHMTSQGQREIINSSGANDYINEEDISLFLSDAKKGDIFITQLELPMVTIKYAISFAKAKGMTIILNPAPASTEITDILYDVNYLIPNEEEYKIITGGTLDLSQASLSMPNLNTIVTLGSDGVYWIDKDLRFSALEVDKAIDSRGAGDAFIGAFAAMLAEGKEVTYAIAFARTVASLSCQVRGVSNGLKPKEEIEAEFLEN